MIAASQGGILNNSSLSKSLSVSSPTINNAISFFERSFIVRLLRPWYSNIGKRLIKSPKIYIRDSGIVNYLLGIFSYEDLLRHPLRGNLWEGYVVEDIINSLTDEYQYYFYRTTDGTECDLVIFKENKCVATIDSKFTPNSKRTKAMTITIQDLQPKIAFYAVPECQAPYTIGENQTVATPMQIIDIIRSL